MFVFKKNNLDKIKSFIRNAEEIEIEKSDKEKLIEMIRPAVGIMTKSSYDKSIEVGKSKIGGKPDLPKGFEWPKVNNISMLFCAQYNLSELKKFNKENILPNKGFFYVFLSLDEKWQEFNGLNQEFMVIHSESENLIRTEFPKEITINQTFKTSLIEYFESYTIPYYENYKLFELEEKYDDFYSYCYQPVSEFLEEQIYQGIDNNHQILGHDGSIQSCVVYDFAARELGVYATAPSEYKNRWKEILKLSKKYELLLQLDCSDTDLTKFGGSGTYYFGLSKTDLEKKDFGDIKMTFQI